MLCRAHPMRVMPLPVIMTMMTMLALMIATGNAWAQSSQCGFITDPDRQA